MDKRTDDGGLCKPESAVARQLGTSGQLFREERVGAKASGNLCIQKMRGRATIGGGDSGRAAWELASKRGCLSGRLDEGLASGSYIGGPRSTARCKLDGDERVGGVNAEEEGGGKRRRVVGRVSGSKGKDWRSQKNQ